MEYWMIPVMAFIVVPIGVLFVAIAASVLAEILG